MPEWLRCVLWGNWRRGEPLVHWSERYLFWGYLFYLFLMGKATGALIRKVFLLCLYSFFFIHFFVSIYLLSKKNIFHPNFTTWICWAKKNTFHLFYWAKRIYFTWISALESRASKQVGRCSAPNGLFCFCLFIFNCLYYSFVLSICLLAKTTTLN